ncbi:MAG: hypothetical protein RI885_2319 [Actinomycetota bacterium]
MTARIAGAGAPGIVRPAPAGGRRRPRRRLSAVGVVANTAMLWLCTAIAASAFWPVYQSPEFVVMVAVTTLVASTIVIAAAVFRLPGYVVVLATIVAYFALGVPIAVPDRAVSVVLPTLEGLRDLTLGTALGWKQLLTITLPVGSYQALLVPAYLLVSLSVTVSLSVALRTRFTALAALGPIVVFLAAILFGETTALFPLSTALGLTAAVLLWLSWARWHDRRAALRRGARASAVSGDVARGSIGADRSGPAGFRVLASAVLIVAIAAGGAAGATAALPPTGEREVLRSGIVQPFDPRMYASPLSGFRSYLAPARADDEMLVVDGLPADTRIRIATLDTYDGIVYSVGSETVSSESGSFTLVPYEFDQSGLAGEEVSIDVTVSGYQGVWLPTVGQLQRISFSGDDASTLRSSFYYNGTSGTAAVVDEVGSGDRYRVDAVVPAQPTGTSLQTLAPGTAEVPALGELPDEVAVALGRWVGDIDGDGARLMAALDGLRATGYISHGVSDDEPPSRSGHSADRITELLTDARMIGDEEQYAVTAAIMARELGFPARVVMGFLPDEAPVDGVTTLTGDDVSAWIEVDTAQWGWVTLDPNPAVREIPDEVPEVPTQVARPQSPVQPPIEEPDVADDQEPPDSRQNDSDTVDPLLAALLVSLQVAGWVVLAAAIVVSPLLAIIATKVRRRRRRRRASTPLQRISGGWREFEDAVLDHGLTPPPSATRSEFASVVAGTTPLMLAAAADRAVFSPSGAEPQDADRVWSSVDDVRSSLDAGLTRRRRWAARLSLASLRRGRRS